MSKRRGMQTDSGTIFNDTETKVTLVSTYSKVRNGMTMWLLMLFSFLVLILSVRALPGTPTMNDLKTDEWTIDGPLEMSNERGRYALMYSVIENNTLFFTKDLADFTAPDNAVRADGKFVSLFAPGVSYIIMPGYLLGKTVSLGQLGASMVIVFFALANILLVRSIAIRLGNHPTASLIAALVFGFATPAFAYAVSIYQHHISTFLILLSIYVLLRFKNLWSLGIIWFLCAVSISVDYPNFFMMLPIGIFALGRLVHVEKTLRTYLVKVKLFGFTTFLTALLPIMLFLSYNYLAHGSPFLLSGTLPTVAQAEYIKAELAKQATDPSTKHARLPDKSNALAFFESRNLLNGFYEHFISPDRGMLVYTPVMLLSIIGVIIAIRREQSLYFLLLGVIGVNVLLYSMWGDPYGGWAFGSRYFVPSYALLAIFLAVTLQRFMKNNLFLFFFYIVLTYAVVVNTLGAVTSNRNPPAVEAQALSRLSNEHEPYTYERNYRFLFEEGSKSFVYRTYASRIMTPFDYYLVLILLITGLTGALIVYLRIFGREVVYET